MKILLFFMLLWVSVCQAQVPDTAWQYRYDMTRSAWRILGPGAPIATLAAQIHQESAWRKDVTSRVGAGGLAQFMPATAEDMAKRYPQDCAPANPFNPKWAFACRDRYMRGLLASVRNDRTTECDEWAFGLRAYNGGLGWIKRDRRMTFDMLENGDDWTTVANYNAGRRNSNYVENREYPIYIFKKENRYDSWGRMLNCLE